MNSTEQALQKVCAIKLENGGEAQQVLRRLELEAKNPKIFFLRNPI